jgi:protein transport protein SEC31
LAGADGEVLIWDLTDLSKLPGVYTPGVSAPVKSERAIDIACVQWNRKVQHILGTTTSTGVTVVWDLKSKKPLMNFSDKSVNGRCRAMAWHPDNATQMVTASLSDERPVIQYWDLRNTYAPVRYLESHTRGVTSLSWSSVDPSLLLSSGTDGTLRVF